MPQTIPTISTQPPLPLPELLISEISNDCPTSPPSPYPIELDPDSSRSPSPFLTHDNSSSDPSLSLTHADVPQTQLTTPELASPSASTPLHLDELAPSPPDLDDLDFDKPSPAMSEAAPVRLAYLRAVLGNIFQGNTVIAATERLNDDLDMAEVCNSLPAFPKPARTIPTAKRRLGLDVDEYIDKRPICTICYKYYSLEDIAELRSPQCTVNNCKGLVYQEEQINGAIRRVPTKIHPYASIIKSLKRLCLRRDFIDKLLPLTGAPESADPQNDLHRTMSDFFDGTACGELTLGLKRVVSDDGRVMDVEIVPGSAMKLREATLGLSLTLNVDWCVRLCVLFICLNLLPLHLGLALLRGILTLREEST